MRCSFLPIVAMLLTLTTNANADVISFTTAPVAANPDALTTPGRDIVGGELFTDFDIATDVFAFDPILFGVSDILFANDTAANLPATGVNTVVLQEFGPPMAAGIAANLIAAALTSSGPGFFIYFNTGLDLPRLVYSTDLSDPTADLQILARLINLSGQAGRDALPTFSSANFAILQVPEPATLLLMAMAGAGSAYRYARRRRRNQEIF
jgi:hypothetical protein